MQRTEMARLERVREGAGDGGPACRLSSRHPLPDPGSPPLSRPAGRGCVPQGVDWAIRLDSVGSGVPTLKATMTDNPVGATTLCSEIRL